MPNTSATGGYLVPTATNGKDDTELAIFFQGLVKGITGIDGSLVRPRWQPEPPNTPDYGVDWASIGVIKKSRDTNAYITHRSVNDLHGINIGTDYVHRTEILDVLCSFYGPNSEKNSELLAVGLEVAQNREVMQLAGYGLVGVDDGVMMADLVNERWLLRIDVPFQMRRAQLYQYPVLDIVEADVTIVDDTGAVDVTIHVVE